MQQNTHSEWVYFFSLVFFAYIFFLFVPFLDNFVLLVSVSSIRFRSENWWKSLSHQHSFHWVCFGFFLRSHCFGYSKSRTFGMMLGSSDFIGCHGLTVSAHLFSCWLFNLLKRDGEQKYPRFIFYRALSVLFIVHSLNNTIELIVCSQMLGTLFYYNTCICKCYRHIYLL